MGFFETQIYIDNLHRPDDLGEPGATLQTRLWVNETLLEKLAMDRMNETMDGTDARMTTMHDDDENGYDELLAKFSANELSIRRFVYNPGRRASQHSSSRYSRAVLCS